MTDVVATAAADAVALNFSLRFLGLHDRLLLTVAVAAMLADVAGRIVRRPAAGRRESPGGRRFSVPAIVLLGTGPWPIAQVTDIPNLSMRLHGLALPAWLRLAASIAVLVIAAWRLMEALGWAPPIKQPLLRQLAGMPGRPTDSPNAATATP